MSVTTQDVKDYTRTLSDFLVGKELNSLLESQGKMSELGKKIDTMRSSTTTLNKEFSERHNDMTPYKMPVFATNQDILLIGLYISYAFLVLISVIVLYKNTQSIQNVAYALVLSLLILLMITALILRLG